MVSFDDEPYGDIDRYDSNTLSQLNTENTKLAKEPLSNSNICIKNSIINVASNSYKSETKSEDSYWLIDGGASLHCTPYLSDFSEYQEYSTPDTINTAHKGSKVDILGEGKVYIHYQLNGKKREMMLKTCYVPDCSGRLFSTGSLKDTGYKESSDKNNTKFFLNDELQLMGFPRNNYGFVHWIKADVIHKYQNHAFSIVAIDNSETWHNRMAHPSHKVLSHLKTNVKGCDDLRVTKTNTICEGCIKGKMHDKTYHSSEKRASLPLELIHADLMEFPVESYHRKKWCLIVLDDYSSLATTFLLRSKSETMQCMKHYVSMMEVHTDYKVKKFRSDPGGEFTSQEFAEYLQNEGIIHEKSAPYVAQQNGHVE